MKTIQGYREFIKKQMDSVSKDVFRLMNDIVLGITDIVEIYQDDLQDYSVNFVDLRHTGSNNGVTEDNFQFEKIKDYHIIIFLEGNSDETGSLIVERVLSEFGDDLILDYGPLNRDPEEIIFIFK